MGLLNLLTAYQKKHLVEFLPYHECDTQSRQAPDLECLIKLQAQHTQQRHLIFLTGTHIKSCRVSDKKKKTYVKNIDKPGQDCGSKYCSF